MTSTTQPAAGPVSTDIWADFPNNYPRTDPADCKPWCRDRTTGHIEYRDGGSEQECSTEGTELTLTLGDEVDFGSGDMRPDYLHTYLWYMKSQGVTVNLSHHEDSGPVMTPVEARQLGEELIRLADLAEAAER